MSFRDLIGCIGGFLVSIVLQRPGASWLTFLGLRPRCVQQSGMLILTDIEPGKVDALLQKLEEIRSRLIGYRKNKQKISFYNTETVHYAAWMILPGIRNPDRKQPPGPAKLAFETNHDGSLVCHLNDLADNCQQELDEVYAFCPDYLLSRSKGQSVAEFLFNKFQQTSKTVVTSAYYVALPGRSLEDIKNAIAVYDEAKNFVDDPSNKSSDPKELSSALIEHFRTRAQEKPVRFPVTQQRLRHLFAMNMGILTLLSLVLLIVLIPMYHWWKGLTSLFEKSMVAVLTSLCLLPLLYFARWLVINVIARYYEDKEQRSQEPFDPTYHRPDYRHLDLGPQNHLCTYATVRPGWFRMYVIRRALWLGPVLFNYFFIMGKLDQMSTIHFARWTLIKQQLIFFSNYDGSWSSYLNDFSDEAWGVNLVWGNTIGFPPTKFIVRRGAHDLERFQAQAAEHYAPAPVFYSAYRDRPLVNLIRYLEFRDKLLEEMAVSPTRQRINSLLAMI